MYHTLRTFVLAAVLVRAFGHQHHSADPLDSQLPVFVQDPILARQEPFTGPTWMEKYGPQIDSSFSGPLSFSHLPYTRCLDNVDTKFDIAILGLPFDTAVTYRPGYLYLRLPLYLFLNSLLIRARFGPYAIRSGSRRQRDARGYTLSWAHDPFAEGQTIIDCGDVSS